ncbi:WYL domain-containing protein [Aliivibrio sp. S3MY1]|uniref:WYL domain-containing protein n=1 Tax=unclassified Aliivibrio TaxID=2645654 RepID=UPI002379685E|nr:MULTISPECIES: WYL domain-containing protein [unclassified Aliivibrio]MDD9197450.1 WYL domain-containing protein [Aliivibrio sp. S3MY1]MDD9200703.1 WYL domain-containing protein [Aliivibrio sp. S2MY1]
MTHCESLVDLRMDFIEQLLLLKGWFTRRDLMCRFDIKEAAATRDIAKYRKLDEFGNNLVFNNSLRRYELKEDTFKPIYIKNITTIISNLKNSKMSNIIGFGSVGIESSPRISEPNLNVIAPISRAIVNKNVITIRYFSIGSGSSGGVKTIAPHSIFDSGSKLYVRCYCFKYEKFLELVVDRIIEVVEAIGDAKDSNLQCIDFCWNKFVNLEIKPHPKIEHPETIKHELKFDGETKVVSVRLALAQYWLQQWNVDCSNDYQLDPKQYHLALVNLDVLSIDGCNGLLAPGFLVKDHN